LESEIKGYFMTDISIGIDIGGTNTVIGIVDTEGNCLAKSQIRTDSFIEYNDYLKSLAGAIKSLLAENDDTYNLRGIGIGAPNGNYFTGTIENAPNLRWKGIIPITKHLQSYIDTDIFLTNDANAAAIGEHIYGAAKNMSDFILVTLGTGLGSGFFANGKLIYGADGFAGELGHTIYLENGRQCGCGRKGCLETYASATGIKTTVRELLLISNEPSTLRDINQDEISAKQISDAAESGDKIALETFEITGKILGFMLSNTVAITSPEAIFLFGGLAKAGNLIFDPVKKYMEQYMLPIFKNKVKILPSGLPEDNAAILGAAALVFNR
jgi:glucokinase